MRLSYLAALTLSTLLANAGVVEIEEGVPYVKVKADGKTYKIERSQDKNAYLTNTFALTSRPSPPFFIEPFSVDNDVETYGELEVLEFISKEQGLFIDARLANWYAKSAIPAAVNIPFKIFLSDSEERTKILKDLGAEYDQNGEWRFENAKTILLYCNGAWCGQSPTAINALIELGYPKAKMKYYRGGMQAWQLLGLTTIVPKEIK
ncbi:MAG: rhodanese-like domain-containing protein [Campylobacterota bacterium]|nr:rhodanese-like domain-containing protein [Campylobacterota bacterium]